MTSEIDPPDELLAEEVERPPLSMSEPVSVTVEARAHGWRVDHYLARLYPNYSRELFRKAIEQSAVQLNGLPVKAARRLRVNDRLSIRLPELPDNTLQPEDLPIQVVYEDDALAVINKPADMVTHPGKGNFKGTLAAAVQFHFDQLSTVAGQLRPGIVHRLDRDTTGVIIIAKDNSVHSRLSSQFEQREVKKEYRAIVRGAKFGRVPVRQPTSATCRRRRALAARDRREPSRWRGAGSPAFPPRGNRLPHDRCVLR